MLYSRWTGSFSEPCRNRACSFFMHAMLLALTALLILVAVAVHYEPAMMNNGDFWRVTRTFANIPSFQPRSAIVELSPSFTIFTSTMGAFFQALSGIAWLFGQSSVDVKVYAFVLLGTLVIGSYASVLADFRNMPMIIFNALIAATFSFLFSSFYEETIVFAIVAILPYTVTKMAEGRSPIFFSIASSALIFAKAQMLVVAPFMFLILLRYLRANYFPRWISVLSIAIISLACLATILAKTLSGAATANDYNRLYNGVGWSALAVQNWPAKDFQSRQKYFYNSIYGDVQDIPEEATLFPDKNLIGTSFWPTGVAILDNATPSEAAALRSDISAKQLLNLLANGSVLRAYLSNVAVVTMQSDYQLSYLRVKQSSPFDKTRSVIDQIALKFGILYIVFLGLISFLCITYRNILPFFFLAALPLFCTIGDGFYEYEKHMVAYYMLLPISLLLLRHSAIGDIWVSAKRVQGLLSG